MLFDAVPFVSKDLSIDPRQIVAFNLTLNPYRP
jgi:hypothetical protein